MRNAQRPSPDDAKGPDYYLHPTWAHPRSSRTNNGSKPNHISRLEGQERWSGWVSPSSTCSLLKSSLSYVWAGFVSQSVTLIRPFSLSGGVIQPQANLIQGHMILTISPKHLCFKSVPHLWNLKRLLCRLLGLSGPIHCLPRSPCARYVMQSYVWWSYMPKGSLYVRVGFCEKVRW